MVQIVRPNEGSSQSNVGISTALAGQTGSGLAAIGQGVTQAGNAFRQTDVAAISRDVGNFVSAQGRQYFEQAKRASQAGQLSNSISNATLTFKKAQMERESRITDENGNPLYDSLVDDIGTIGKTIAEEEASKILDPQLRARFKNQFSQYVTNQQITSLRTARNQQLDFSKSSLDKGLTALLQQGADDNAENIASYEAQAQDILNDATSGGVIGMEERNAKVAQFQSALRNAVYTRMIDQQTAKAHEILQNSADSLGISESEKDSLAKILGAKVQADKLEVVKAKEADERDRLTSQATLAEEIEKRIEADAIRPDEFLKLQPSLNAETFKSLSKKFTAEATKRAKANRTALEISRSLSTGASLEDFSKKDVERHFNQAVETKVLREGRAVTLEEKAKIATAYKTQLPSFAKEINTSLLSGNPERAKEAVSAYTYIRDRGANTLDTSGIKGNSALSSDAVAIAEYAELLVERTNVPLADAITMARDRVTESKDPIRKELTTKFRKESAFRTENLEETINDNFGVEGFFGSNIAVDQETLATYQAVASEMYVKLGGDADAAAKAAAGVMKSSHGVSTVSGKETFMFNPPEKAFPEMSSEEMRNILLQEVRDSIPADVDLESVSISADEKTAGYAVRTENGQVKTVPTWLVTYEKEVGGVTMKVPLINEQSGQLKRWTPAGGSTVDETTQRLLGELEQDLEVAKEKLIQNKIEVAKVEQQANLRSAAAKLGEVSSKYESGNLGVSAISSGKGDPGGKSYGKFQLASKTGTLNGYLRFSQYKDEFKGMRPGSAEFDSKWRELSARDPEGFAQDQKAFITKTLFAPVRTAANSLGIKSTPAVNEAIFSMSVQHGGAKRILRMAGIKDGDSEAVTINKLFNAREKYVRGLRSLTATTKRAILNRYKSEKRDILNMVEE